MTGNDLKTLRQSLGLTVAQAAILMDGPWAWPTVERIERGDDIAGEKYNYEHVLQRWQAAGERKDTE